MGVFGSPGFTADQKGLADSLSRHDRLINWMAAAGLDLEKSAAGPRAVDAMIDAWRDDPSVAPGLSNEVGLYLGDVMLHEIRGARWHVWPNGHPVVRLEDGREFDVSAQAARRVSKGKPNLNASLEEAALPR